MILNDFIRLGWRIYFDEDYFGLGIKEELSNEQRKMAEEKMGRRVLSLVLSPNIALYLANMYSLLNRCLYPVSAAHLSYPSFLYIRTSFLAFFFGGEWNSIFRSALIL